MREESLSLFATIVAEAAQESPLWAASLRAEADREQLAIFSPLALPRYGLGLETIYEGYLLHHGRSRLFLPADQETEILLGDYLYAHGLVRIAELGEVEVVADLAELIALCSELRIEGDAGGDGLVWAATAAALGRSDGRLAQARTALRAGDGSPLLGLAESLAGGERVRIALELHGTRLD